MLHGAFGGPLPRPVKIGRRDQATNLQLAAVRLRGSPSCPMWPLAALARWVAAAMGLAVLASACAISHTLVPFVMSSDAQMIAWAKAFASAESVRVDPGILVPIVIMSDVLTIAQGMAIASTVVASAQVTLVARIVCCNSIQRMWFASTSQRGGPS